MCVRFFEAPERWLGTGDCIDYEFFEDHSRAKDDNIEFSSVSGRFGVFGLYILVDFGNGEIW